VAFSSDSETVASGSWDGTVRLWNVATSEETYKLYVPEVVRKIGYHRDESIWITDIGRLRLGFAADTTSTEARTTILHANSWIKRNGADFLWLPTGYRGSHDIFISSLVIGQMSGAVSFLSFI
jgi:WD40 repeat protein